MMIFGRFFRTRGIRGFAAGFGLVAICGGALAQPGPPTYTSTFFDAITGDNAYQSGGNRRWDVDLGSDRYQNDFYERPMVQTFGFHGGRYSANEYFEYLDITTARIGFDSQYLYASITLFGRDKSTADGVDTPVGLVERYGFRFGPQVDGRGAVLLVVDQPEFSGTTFNPLKTFGYLDTNNDVGGRGLFNGGPTGRNVTKSDNALEEAGMDGFDEDIISDGKINGSGPAVLWARLKPGDNTTVEMALSYGALGLTQTDLLATQYLEFESNKGTKDPQKYLWNDKYTQSEAGSPNPGSGGLSEFGTQGLGNIYELDTLPGGAIVPEPASMAALALGVGALLRRRRSK